MMRPNDAILLPYQQRWIADTTPVKIVEKSRRIGLSYAEACAAVLHAAAADGANVYYISYDKEMTQGFVSDCATWAQALQAGAGEIGEDVLRDAERDIMIYTIRFPSGHKIATFSSAPRNLRSKGRPGEWLIIDEAAFVDDLGELLKAAMAMTMWGGEIHIISTHNGEENPFNELIRDVRSGRQQAVIHRITLDDAISDGLYRRICQVSGRAWSAASETQWRADLVRRYRPNDDEELFCIAAYGGGAYLPRALIERCMIDAPVVRYAGDAEFNAMPEALRRNDIDRWIADAVEPLLRALDTERRHALGMDFARSGDMSVIAPIEIGASLRRRVPWLIEMHNVPHRQQEQVLLRVMDGLPRFAGAAIDAGGNGSYIAEAAGDHKGGLVDAVRFSEEWYRVNMPPLKAAFEDSMLTIPRHDDVLEDFRSIQLVRGVPRVPEGKTDKHGQRHGDSAIAIALAYYAAGRDTGPIEFESTGQRRAAFDLAPAGDSDDRSDRGYGAVRGNNDFTGWMD